MLVAIGGILIWLMRPYAIKMITLGIVGYAVALCIIQYVTIKHKNFNYVLKKELRSGLAMLSSLIVINAFLFLPLPFQIGETINDQKKGDHSACYNKNKWNFLNDLITARKNYYLTYPNANFNIDANYDITSETNMLKYLPRAILLGFLAPFPHNIIKTNSKKPINNLVLIEIIIIYLGLFGLILSVFKIPDKTVPILVFCLITITIYVYAIPNIGTIYRLRMPYLWPLISLGLANLSNHCAFKNILQKLQKSLNNDITSI